MTHDIKVILATSIAWLLFDVVHNVTGKPLTTAGIALRRRLINLIRKPERTKPVPLWAALYDTDGKQVGERKKIQ